MPIKVKKARPLKKEDNLGKNPKEPLASRV
jgi:hypothetical protein